MFRCVYFLFCSGRVDNLLLRISLVLSIREVCSQYLSQFLLPLGVCSPWVRAMISVECVSRCAQLVYGMRFVNGEFRHYFRTICARIYEVDCFGCYTSDCQKFKHLAFTPELYEDWNCSSRYSIMQANLMGYGRENLE